MCFEPFRGMGVKQWLVSDKETPFCKFPRLSVAWPLPVVQMYMKKEGQTEFC